MGQEFFPYIYGFINGFYGSFITWRGADLNFQSLTDFWSPPNSWYLQKLSLEQLNLFTKVPCSPEGLTLSWIHT